MFFTEERQSIGLPGLGAARTRRIQLDPRILARLDASMAVRTDDDGTATARIGYEPVLFAQTTMERLVDDFLQTQAAVAEEPDMGVDDLDLGVGCGSFA